ncbi:MAG: TIM barrel protein [Armatimonadota bacterium]
MRVGFSCRSTVKGMKNPRPDGLGEYDRVIEVIMQCEDWGLFYYNMPPEVIGWGDYSKYKPDVTEMETKFADLLERIRDMSEITNVLLSIHAAAYNVPTSDDPVILERSIREINAERRALEMCGGGVLYIHPGYAMNNPVETREKLVGRLSRLPESSVPLGIEVDDVGIGDLDTVLYLASVVPGAVPVVDFGHLYGRGWKLDSSDDFLEVLEMVRPLSGKRVFTHFSAVVKRKHIPLEEGLPDYRLFAQAAAQFEWQGDQELVVLIESPQRELDAILFKNAFTIAAKDMLSAA